MRESLLMLKAFHKKYWTRYNFDNKAKPNQSTIIDFLIIYKGYLEEYDKILLAMFVWEFWKVIYYLNDPTDKSIKELITRVNNSLN